MNKKETIKLAYMDSQAVYEIYPDVESIRIVADASAYSELHYDFIIKPADSLNMAILPCENRNCTAGYFYLNEKIRFALARKESTIEGEMKCSGHDSENHLNQSCVGVLKYKVEITHHRNL
jgi:hypothetical protein